MEWLFLPTPVRGALRMHVQFLQGLPFLVATACAATTHVWLLWMDARCWSLAFTVLWLDVVAEGVIQLESHSHHKQL